MSIYELKELKPLIRKTVSTIFSNEDAPDIDYSTRDLALNIVYNGYPTLPDVYHKAFVNPIRSIIETSDYSVIIGTLGARGLWAEWMAAMDQRASGYKKEATHAFEECIADLYDGFLSNEARMNVNLPDYEKFSPLVKWGNPSYGPYTCPVDAGWDLGITVATVSLPPRYSENIVLWSALGHECAGHDILHADKGLLSELANKVYDNVIKHGDDPAFKDKTAIVNGREKPFIELAAMYWKYVIDEVASDVCGLLNLGPAAGIGVATLLLSARDGRLLTFGPSSDDHPIDALRVLLAADVVRDIPNLDIKYANAWADALEAIVANYVVFATDKRDIRLGTEIGNSVHWDIILPYDAMRETVPIVARTIAFMPMDSLEGHFLCKINTWSNTDEYVLTRLVDDFLNGRKPTLDFGRNGPFVYAAHILAAATVAAANGPDLEGITALAIGALNELYDSNPVWQGFRVRLRSNVYTRKLAPKYLNVEPAARPPMKVKVAARAGR